LSDRSRVKLAEQSSRELVLRSKTGSSHFDTPDFEVLDGLLPEFVEIGHAVRITVTIESPHTRNEWARAFAKQGASDLVVYRMLAQDSRIADCHRLHYLQMAGEKIARGYLLRHTKDRSLGDLLSTHEALESFVRLYRKSPEATARYAGHAAQFDELMNQVRGLAAEIEKLAPAVDRQRWPANAEYPWSNGARLTVPCEYAYPVTSSFAPNVWKALDQVLADVSEDLGR
jgi:hypothetical protein